MSAFNRQCGTCRNAVETAVDLRLRLPLLAPVFHDAREGLAGA